METKKLENGNSYHALMPIAYGPVNDQDMWSGIWDKFHDFYYGGGLESYLNDYILPRMQANPHDGHWNYVLHYHHGNRISNSEFKSLPLESQQHDARF